MARQIEISESELLNALSEVKRARYPDPVGAFVISELASRSGIPESTLRYQMRMLLSQGKAERVYVQRERCDGKIAKVPAYRYVKAKR